MKIKICEEENNLIQENPQDIENDYADSDSSSLFNEKILTKINKKKQLFQHSFNLFDLSILKNLSTSFFIIFIMTIFSISIQTINNINSSSFYLLSRRKNVYNFFSYYFSEQNYTMKYITIFSQFIFLLLSGCLCILFNQRMSVPEYNNNKFVNILCCTSSILSAFCIFFLTFYYKEVNPLFRDNGIVDNGIFVILLLSLILTCLFSYFALKVVITKEEEENNLIFKIKEFILGMMIMTFITYFLCLVIVSVFIPSSYNEFMLISILMFAMEISAIGFLISFSFFALSLRFDIEYVYNVLKKRPDVEYFIDNNSNYAIDKDEF